MRSILLLACLAISVAVNSQSFSVYFIGDAGEPVFPSDRTLEFLKTKTSGASQDDILIFLGDNVYPLGIPGKEHPEREEMELKLEASLQIMKDFKGRSFMIPGNHDWASGKKYGWEQVLHMEEFVKDYLQDESVFLPGGGCPGPIEVPLTEKHTLVLVDTQYLLFPWEKPGESSACDAKSSSGALVIMNEILSRNRNKHVLVAGHHPMYSYGPHGGKYTFRQHLFPLTDIKRSLYIPLPVIGSIYPGFRTLFGSLQDIPNPRYKLVRNSMVESFDQVSELVYINGHEHSLQYIPKNGKHYITSGSGSKSSNLKEGKELAFGFQGKGFAQLDYSEHGEVTLKFWDGENQKLLFEQQLYSKEVKVEEKKVYSLDFSDSTITVPISGKYDSASESRKLFLGENYRDVWSQPIEIPVFDIGTEHGGLKIIKLGGGNQTKSLRLEAADGKQYVLRSLDKYTDKLLPDALQKTIAADILQDQISGANPFGAFAIPPLADAAGIYHTNPKIVFIPDDPRFGEYRKIFSGLVCLYEERPNNEAAEETFFGGGEKVKGTPDLIEILKDDNDERVDQGFALRSRLFDMVIADWDRHEDQWRWVRFDDEYGHYWRPIPRDRDQAFFKGEGLISWLASRRFALPNTEGFNEQMRYPPGYNTSPRFFDRTFLNGLDWNDWNEQIDILRENLSDEVIQSAIKESWPPEVFDLEGEETIRVLKARRDDMVRFAKIHYLFISREVEVVGTDKHEHFLVERLNDEETQVTVRKRKKNGDLEQILYKRIFKKSETKEIRLYGLDGEDVFELKGEVKKGIKIRIIGGTDKDVVENNSDVSGLFKKTFIYDRKKSTRVTLSKDTKIHLSKNPEINAYNRTAFQYNKLIPLVSTEFNPDDGIFLGAGFMFTYHKWRKTPFAGKHSLSGNFAVATGAFNFYYKGTLTDVLGSLDLNADFSFQRPFGIDNFFGVGNETEFDQSNNNIPVDEDDPIDYYRIRYERSNNFLSLSYNLGNKGLLSVGPEYLVVDVQNQLDKYINDEANNLPENIFDTFQYLGAKVKLETDSRDKKMFPTKGLYGAIALEHFSGLNDISEDFDRVSGELIFHISRRIPARVTLSNRIGGMHNFQETPFFNGARVGRSNLRGYRRSRFIGQSSFYHNVDLRIKLFSFRTYLFPGSLGLLGFHDIGRVWVSNENSDKWHAGKGFGIWLAPINQIAINTFVAFSEDETQVLLKFGFQF